MYCRVMPAHHPPPGALTSAGGFLKYPNHRGGNMTDGSNSTYLGRKVILSALQNLRADLQEALERFDRRAGDLLVDEHTLTESEGRLVWAILQELDSTDTGLFRALDLGGIRRV